MDKNIIKKHLTQKFVNEAKDESATPGITVTNAAKKKSGEENNKAVKDMEKELGNYDKTLTKGMETTDVPNKFNYSNKEEIEYHQQMEIMNGQEMIQYDRDPIQEFKDRAKEGIVGSARMGNNPEWANVIPAQKGFTGPDFGKNLVKSIEASFEKRMNAEKGNYSFGDDIENENRAGLVMTRHSALAENKNDNNKQQIKESMKRLKFKKEFKGVGNALKMIPESYKVDNKIFEMTDGVENYKIRWEGSLTEGRAVILVASDKNLVNEDMQKMKHLMGYKSQETLGNVKGKARLDENAKFTDIWKKTKSLMESEEELEETAEVKEKADVKQAPEAKKHVQGSVSTEKGTQAPAPKTGNLEDVKKKAPEATKHVQGSVSSEKGTQAPKPKTGNWDENVKGQAPEAKKHVTMKEGVTINGITFEPINENWMEEGTYEEGVYEGVSEFMMPTSENDVNKFIFNLENNQNIKSLPFNIQLDTIDPENPGKGVLKVWPNKRDGARISIDKAQYDNIFELVQNRFGCDLTKNACPQGTESKSYGYFEEGVYEGGVYEYTGEQPMTPEEALDMDTLKQTAFKELATSKEMDKTTGDILNNMSPEDIENLKSSLMQLSEGLMNESDFANFSDIVDNLQSKLNENSETNQLKVMVGNLLSRFGRLNAATIGTLPFIVGYASEKLGMTPEFTMGRGEGMMAMLASLIGGAILWRLGDKLRGKEGTI